MTTTYKKLFVIWQDPQSRSHFPVGELWHENELYQFRYIEGAKDAMQYGFKAFLSFPELETTYSSEELFPFFKNRILQPEREEYAEFVKGLGLSPDAEPIEILGRSGGRRATDSIEVFAPAEIHNGVKGYYTVNYFFLVHGLSHMRECAQNLATDLIKAKERLFLMHDFQNPVDTNALVLRTEQYCCVGFVPRYLLDDVWKLTKKAKEFILEVDQVNKPPMPVQQRILCKITALVDEDFKPCSDVAYKPY